MKQTIKRFSWKKLGLTFVFLLFVGATFYSVFALDNLKFKVKILSPHNNEQLDSLEVPLDFRIKDNNHLVDANYECFYQLDYQRAIYPIYLCESLTIIFEDDGFHHINVIAINTYTQESESDEVNFWID